VARAWDLNEKASFLHALALNEAYGAVTALAAPLSVGGKVVMLSSFDTVRVWSHLLGIGVNNSQPLPKVNFFPSLPSHYAELVERHNQLFGSDVKKLDYVRAACKKRLRATVSSLEPLPHSVRSGWRKATGHDILDCYTTLAAGTVLSEGVPNEEAKNHGQNGGQQSQPKERPRDQGGRLTVRKANYGLDDHFGKPGMTPLDGVSTRVVRLDADDGFSGISRLRILDEDCKSGQACSGKLQVRSPGAGRVSVRKNGQNDLPKRLLRTGGAGDWLDTGDQVTLDDGRLYIVGQQEQDKAE